MFTWNVEDMALMNEKGRIFIGKERIYRAEHDVSREVKIAFVDCMQDGKLSYLLHLIEKFNEDSKTMPKDSWGNVKTVSLKAWIKRNDTQYPRPILDTDYHYGQYYLLGMKRNITSNYKGQWDTYEDLVNELFHRQLKECEKLEQHYFAEHDECSVLKAELTKKQEMFKTTFGLRLGFSGSRGVKLYDGRGRERDLTVEELKEIIARYDELEVYIAKLSSDIDIEF